MRLADRSDRSSSHEIKAQIQASDQETELDSRNLLPVIGRNVIRFNTELTPEMYKTRSEVRVRGADYVFTDSTSDPTQYVAFDVFVPTGGVNNLVANRTWNIIWQVAQSGTGIESGYSRNSSPPMSISLFGRKIYMNTISSKYPANIWTGDWNSWRNDQSFSGDAARISKFEAAPTNRPPKYIGWLSSGRWNRVFIEFKLGRHGFYNVWLNRSIKVRSGDMSIGYQMAADQNISNPIVQNADGVQVVSKRASSRFGIYQGYKGNYRRNSYSSEILFRRFATGTNRNVVFYGR